MYASSKAEIVSAKRLNPDTPNSTLLTYKRRRSKEKSVKEEVKEKPLPEPLSLLKNFKEPWKRVQAAQKGHGNFRVGTSGYIYNHWKGVVYPKEYAQKEWFRLYTYLFDTVEINNTFYRLPKPEVFKSWYDQAPPDFCYALKYSRYGTHMKRLKDPDGHIGLFVEHSAPLQESCGPILVQLPPKFKLNLERLREFLENIPKGFRWAIEVRDSRWLCDEVYELLKHHNIALCIHDHEDILDMHPKVITSDWIYLRFHGRNYRHNYNRKELEEYAAWIQEQLSKGIDVFAYFNNDFCGYAVGNALTLRDLVSSTST